MTSYNVLDSNLTCEPVGTWISKASIPILLLLSRLVSVFRQEGGKKKQMSCSFLSPISVLSIYFPCLCWRWNEAEREDVGRTAMKWRPGPFRSVCGLCICILSASVCDMSVSAGKNKLLSCLILPVYTHTPIQHILSLHESESQLNSTTRRKTTFETWGHSPPPLCNSVIPPRSFMNTHTPACLHLHSPQCHHDFRRKSFVYITVRAA